MSDMIKGSCRYCGRMEMVEAMDQEGADHIVTQLCACEDATKNRRRQEVRGGDMGCLHRSERRIRNGSDAG